MSPDDDTLLTCPVRDCVDGYVSVRRDFGPYVVTRAERCFLCGGTGAVTVSRDMAYEGPRKEGR